MRWLQQDGGRAHMKQPENKAAAHPNGYKGTQKTLTNAAPQSVSSSGTSSLSTRSPAKQKQRVNSPDRPLTDPDMEVNGPTGADTIAQCHTNDPIAAFSTLDRPLSVTVLKEILLSLKASLQSDLTAKINNCQREVQAIGSRVDHMEQKMGEYTSSFTLVNALVNAF